MFIDNKEMKSRRFYSIKLVKNTVNCVKSIFMCVSVFGEKHIIH